MHSTSRRSKASGIDRPRHAAAAFAAVGLILALAAPAAADPSGHDPATILDIATLDAGVDDFTRVSGAAGEFRFGFLGVPVTGGLDHDGDGHADYGVGYMLASPLGRFIAAGEAHLIFGDGSTSRDLDLATAPPDVLRIAGTVPFEATGNEVWSGDITGDGLGDFLIARQNFDPGGRLGAGALTIVVGSPQLRTLAQTGQILDLAAPPVGVTLVHIVGAEASDRLGIWMRVGDVDGDGVDDLVVAADQESDGADRHSGAVYVLRGGAHLAQPGVIDLAGFGAGTLDGAIARIVPGAGSNEFHLGATNFVADLDGDGRAEVLVGAALNRAGAVLGPTGFGSSDAVGGAPAGRAWILWDELFPPVPWPTGLTIDLSTADSTALTVISGGAQNVTFGEELVGGVDVNGNGKAELLIGDLVGDGTDDQSRPVSGVGYVLFDVERTKGKDFVIDDPPPAVRVTKILGPVAGAIGSDTAAQGDFDGDGYGDFAIGNPHDNPAGRTGAGTLHILFGRPGSWPKLVDTAVGQFPPAGRLRITEVWGERGEAPLPATQPVPPSPQPVDVGDTLCYSAAAGDIDGDGKTDLITNEMVGNGKAPEAFDVGNLIILPGDLLSDDDDDGDDDDDDEDDDDEDDDDEDDEDDEDDDDDDDD
ncbi:MAG: hypothetical protein AAGC60_10910 [Acidobacteriota bacterium]